MTATTPINGLPYYLPGDPADIAAATKGLADAADSRLVPRFTTSSARDIAIPSPVVGQVCMVGGDFQVRISSKWQSVAEGLVGQFSGPPTQLDFGATFTGGATFSNVIGISVTLYQGRTYEVSATIRGTQITAAGIPTVYFAQSTDGTNEIVSAARLIDGTETRAINAFVSGTATALITPGSTGTSTFYVVARSSAGALRFATSSCRIWVKDIGAA